ncbi:MAG: trypsin-like serine protease [Myxococcales bacterium]|nr:trypsin-like serine protease [Myxococcales bacterium]
MTAAHCFFYRPQGRPTPDTFRYRFLPAGATQTVDIKVERIFQFAAIATDRDVPESEFNNVWRTNLPSLRGNDDVAIARLAAEAPPTLIPVRISSVAPTTGDIVTTFGFGCTDGTTLRGDGRKRSKTWTYVESEDYRGSQESGAICEGDSGGPAIFGAASSGGAIWGVNSASSATRDIFGDVTWYGDRVLDAIQRMEGGIARGIQREGEIYQEISVSGSPDLTQACRDACTRANLSCAAFTLFPVSGTCRLFRAVGGWKANPVALSGVRATEEAGVDILGAALPEGTVTLTNGSAESCRSLCGVTKFCRAFSWENATKVCRMKGSFSSRANNAAFLSGVSTGLAAQIERTGPSYKSIPLTSPDPYRCRSECDVDARCRAYNYFPGGFLYSGSPPTCQLKSAAGNVTWRNSVFSGAKRGLSYGVDRPGNTYSTVSEASMTAEQCQTACSKDSMCKAFTFWPANWTKRQWSRCELKSTESAATPMPSPQGDGVISGIRGDSFF